MARRLCKILWMMGALIYSMSVIAAWNPSNTRELSLELNKGTVLEIGKNTGSVFVADPSIVDFHVKLPGVLYLYTKRLGTTSLYVTDTKGRVAYRYTIRVIQNLSTLKSIIRQVVPQANIKIISAGDSIILRGSVGSAAQAQDLKTIAAKFMGSPDKVLTFLHVTAPTQVNLRVQLMEMSRDVVRSLGIDWTGGFSTPKNKILINPLLMPFDFAQAAAEGAIPNRIQFANLLTGGNFNLNAIINVLEQNGLVTVLSEPNLTALSGETASFLVGGEFPIPIPQGNTGAVTVMFKKFGVSLGFSPTILENGKINLQVRPEVSQLSQQGAVTINGFQVPSLSTRRAKTIVELRSGQSFAIAGLLQNNASKLIQQLPGLGSLPILGNLFRSERFQRSETELVIIVTPYIVHPAGNNDFLYPTDNANTDMLASYSNKSNVKNLGFILD